MEGCVDVAIRFEKIVFLLENCFLSFVLRALFKDEFSNVFYRVLAAIKVVSCFLYYPSFLTKFQARWPFGWEECKI